MGGTKPLFLLERRGWIVFSVLRLTQLGYSSFILLAFVLSVVDGVPQKRRSHLLVARFSLMFVSQPVDYGDVSVSPACFPERLECFFLCCLKSFLRLEICIGYSRPPGPDEFPVQGVCLFTESLLFSSWMMPSGLGALWRRSLAGRCWGFACVAPVCPDGWI